MLFCLANIALTIALANVKQLQDGVPGVTECPIPPNGGSRTYTFIARQYGTSWYRKKSTILIPETQDLTTL